VACFNEFFPESFQYRGIALRHLANAQSPKLHVSSSQFTLTKSSWPRGLQSGPIPSIFAAGVAGSFFVSSIAAARKAKQHQIKIGSERVSERKNINQLLEGWTGGVEDLVKGCQTAVHG